MTKDEARELTAGALVSNRDWIEVKVEAPDQEDLSNPPGGYKRSLSGGEEDQEGTQTQSKKSAGGARTRILSLDDMDDESARIEMDKLLAWERRIRGESYLCASELELLGESKEYREAQHRYCHEED